MPARTRQPKRPPARTRSLKRTLNTPAEAIDTELTRGARSTEADEGTNAANHEPPAATDTPAANSTGAASAPATTLHQLNRKNAPRPTATHHNKTTATTTQATGATR
jgi:hypothetical protein